MIPAIYDRRSIRKFSSRPIDERDLLELMDSAARAPSSKNSQPWKYVIVTGNAKNEMLDAYRRGLAREGARDDCPPQWKQYLAAAAHTGDIMEQAPVTVLAVNPLGRGMDAPQTLEERVLEICSIQSISASIQNLLLAATDKGIGSLWICDIYFAYPELSAWLGEEGQLVAAVVLGYPEESPEPRPRKPLEDILRWRR